MTTNDHVQDDTLLITLTGHDRPGVTASLFDAISAFDGVVVLDIEQLVVRQQLVLTVLLRLNGASSAVISNAIRHTAATLGMRLETELGASDDDERRRNRVHITVLGAPLRPDAVAGLAATIAAEGGNIDRIRRIASYPITAIVLEGSGAHPAHLQAVLSARAAELGVDVAVRRAGLDRRGQHLVVMDVDSTLINDEVIDVLAARAGAGDAVAQITARAMAGELDFEASLRERVAALAGLDESVIDAVREEITLTPGARTLVRTLKRLGYVVALVSGGFVEVIEPLARELGVDHVRANRLEVRDGKLTGNVAGSVIDRRAKRAALEEFAAAHGLPLSRTIAIGDGANDQDMLAAAGLGVAFNAKPALQEVADTSINVPYLDALLFILGITREEIEAADEDSGVSVRMPRVAH